MKIRFVLIGARFSASELSYVERRPVVREEAEFVGAIVPHWSLFPSHEMLAVIDAESLAEVASHNFRKRLFGFANDDLMPRVEKMRQPCGITHRTMRPLTADVIPRLSC